MATQFVYPIADVTTEWTPSDAVDHYTLLDETSPNTTDYISVSGFTAGKVERLVLDPGDPLAISVVSQYKVRIDLNSAGLGNTPALRAKFYVGPSETTAAENMYGFTEFQCDTGGDWDFVTWTIPLPLIPASKWFSDSIELELIPINGDTGYSPAS